MHCKRKETEERKGVSERGGEETEAERTRPELAFLLCPAEGQWSASTLHRQNTHNSLQGRPVGVALTLYAA